jgi:nicotinamidase/pyrazinamidase
MDILMVMCPQNSFFSPKGSVYMGESADILLVRLVDYLSTFKKSRIFLKEKHAMEDTFFVADKTHSVATTEDYQVPKALTKFADFSYDKVRYSAFFESQVDIFLRQRNARHVGLVGVETHTSILFTAEELRNRNYEVTVVEPCTMSRDEHMHGFAISLMKHSLGVRMSNG